VPRTLKIPMPYVDEDYDRRKFSSWMYYGIDNLGRCGQVVNLLHPGFWRWWWIMWKGARWWAMKWHIRNRKVLVFADGAENHVASIIEARAAAKKSIASPEDERFNYNLMRPNDKGGGGSG
jgi:predicted nicotinamide N-methyase